MKALYESRGQSKNVDFRRDIIAQDDEIRLSFFSDLTDHEENDDRHRHVLNIMQRPKFIVWNPSSEIHRPKFRVASPKLCSDYVPLALERFPDGVSFSECIALEIER
jgi:hypothetical protein